MVGASGTGKTSIIAAHILNGGLSQDLWMPVCVTLSSRTTANMLQEQVSTLKTFAFQHQQPQAVLRPGNGCPWRRSSYR